VYGTYAYVQSAGYQEEVRQDRLLYGNYGTLPAGAWWQRFQRPLKNAANTSVVCLGDRLLALWEGGLPHHLDGHTLATQGLDPLGLGASDRYSAHPKRDPLTGHLYNFGVSLGAITHLHLYCHSPQGHLIQRQSFPLTGMPMIHDFALVGPYLVFCVSPVHLNLWPAALQLRSFSQCLTWQPHRGTEILIFRQDTLTLHSRHTTDPWYQWHYSNGWINPQGHLVLDLVRYDDFATNEFLREVATGAIHTLALGNLWRMTLDPATGHLLHQEPLTQGGCEFPQVPPQAVGRLDPDSSNPDRPAPIALVHHRPHQDPQGELFGALALIPPAGDPVILDLGDDRYPSEPIWAGSWLLSVVFDGTHRTSEVWILAADRLQDGPVARLALPHPIPHSFHGTWLPRP